MDKLTVPFRNSHLSITIEEAEKLQSDLTAAITRAKQYREGLRPVEQSKDGFIDRDAFYEFFAQVYTDRAVLRNHAGKLFANLVRSANGWKGNVVPIDIVCGRCGNHVSKSCTAKGYTVRRHHYHNDETYRIKVASLKRHSAKFNSCGIHTITDTTRRDLRLLLEHL